MNHPDSSPASSPQHEPSVSPRAAAVAVASLLIDRGFTAYFAGGCVRDEILGLVPSDFDIATSARPQDIAAVFRGARGVGEAFGVMLVHWKGRVIEVATFRTDGEYQDGRRPSEVRFATAREDAQRRDFTINGLFRDTRTDEIVDFVDGQKDLSTRTLRAIGDPAARLREDRLRTLRAVRFTARFEMSVDPLTEQAIRDAARDLVGVSRERIGGEFRRMFSHPTRLRAVQLIEEWGLDAPALGERHSRGECPRVAALQGEVSFATVLAAWRLDRTARSSALAPNDWRESLNLSIHEAKEQHEILEIVAGFERKWNDLPRCARKRMASKGSFAAAVNVLHGTQPDRAVEILAAVAALAAEPGGLSPPPILTGSDLIALGYEPGPRFKSLLERLYDEQLEGRIASRAVAIAFVIEQWKP